MLIRETIWFGSLYPAGRALRHCFWISKFEVRVRLPRILLVFLYIIISLAVNVHNYERRVLVLKFREGLCGWNCAMSWSIDIHAMLTTYKFSTHSLTAINVRCPPSGIGSSFRYYGAAFLLALRESAAKNLSFLLRSCKSLQMDEKINAAAHPPLFVEGSISIRPYLGHLSPLNFPRALQR